MLNVAFPSPNGARRRIRSPHAALRHAVLSNMSPLGSNATMEPSRHQSRLVMQYPTSLPLPAPPHKSAKVNFGTQIRWPVNVLPITSPLRASMPHDCSRASVAHAATPHTVRSGFHVLN